MTLEELDDELKKKADKENQWKASGQETTTDYLKRKANEDVFLKKFQCPTCFKDVRMNLIANNEHYYCKGTPISHYFVRYIPLHKHEESKPPIVINLPDDKKEATIYWGD